MEDSHRVFVQMMMAKQLATEQEAVQKMEKIFDKLGGDPPRGGLTEFLNVINRNLQTVSMEIGRGASEDDGTIYYAFVNTHQDEHAKLARSYHTKVVDYFKKVLELIVNSEGSASSTDLLNASATLEKRLTKTDATAALHQFVADGWLSHDRHAGEYAIGIRGLIELKPYLRSTFDLEVCDLCKDIAVRGVWVNHKKVHKHCNERRTRLSSLPSQ